MLSKQNVKYFIANFAEYLKNSPFIKSIVDSAIVSLHVMEDIINLLLQKNLMLLLKKAEELSSDLTPIKTLEKIFPACKDRIPFDNMEFFPKDKKSEQGLFKILAEVFIEMSLRIVDLVRVGARKLTETFVDILKEENIDHGLTHEEINKDMLVINSKMAKGVYEIVRDDENVYDSPECMPKQLSEEKKREIFKGSHSGTSVGKIIVENEKVEDLFAIKAIEILDFLLTGFHKEKQKFGLEQFSMFNFDEDVVIQSAKQLQKEIDCGKFESHVYHI